MWRATARAQAATLLMLAHACSSQLISAIRSDISTARDALGVAPFDALSQLGTFLDSVTQSAKVEEEEEFSFMAPPEGYECNDDEECVLPDLPAEEVP